MSDHAARADDGAFPDRQTAKDRSVAPDGGAALDPCADAGPIRLALQRTRIVCSGGIFVVYENHAVTDKDGVFNGHPFADEGMTGDLDHAADPGALLNLHERADLGPIADLTAIEVREGIYRYIAAQFHVGCDAHKIPWCHQLPPWSRR